MSVHRSMGSARSECFAVLSAVPEAELAVSAGRGSTVSRAVAAARTDFASVTEVATTVSRADPLAYRTERSIQPLPPARWRAQQDDESVPAPAPKAVKACRPSSTSASRTALNMLDLPQLGRSPPRWAGPAACGCTWWCSSPAWPATRLGDAARGPELLQQPLVLGASGLMAGRGVPRRQDSGPGYVVGPGAHVGAHPRWRGARRGVFGADQGSWAMAAALLGGTLAATAMSPRPPPGRRRIRRLSLSPTSACRCWATARYRRSVAVVVASAVVLGCAGRRAGAAGC